MAKGEIRVDGNRLWESLMEMARIGATENGGVNRQALSDEDRKGRDQFVGWCKDAGCDVRIDRIGNIFARRSGRDSDSPPVITGSHLDSQPTGGRFDGAYGVLAGLEVVRTLNDYAIDTERPLEVVVWTNEEGCRFAPAMTGSGVFTGAYDPEFALGLEDPEGKSLGDELKRIGYAGNSEPTGHDLYAYIEAHIEQGPVLEAEEQTIGIVTGALGQRWYELSFEGIISHAGPTPMTRRRDALLGAARAVDLVNRIGLEHAPFASATVGMLEVHPNSRNVVPGRAFLTIDFRHPEDDELTRMDREMRAGVAAIAETIGLAHEIEEIFHYAPISFDSTCIDAVRNAARECGYEARDMVSGAGHDACFLSRVAPTSMVFIPSIGGISHNEAEDSKPEWVRAGADVLLHATLRMANEPLQAKQASAVESI